RDARATAGWRRNAARALIRIIPAACSRGTHARNANLRAHGRGCGHRGAKMGKNMLLGAAIVVVLAAGCSREQAADTTPGRTAASEQTDPDPARSATPATPSRVGEGGTLVTDASDVTDTLGVFTAGEAAPAYVVDSNRRAVYLLEGDADGSGCKDACLRDW